MKEPGRTKFSFEEGIQWPWLSPTSTVSSGPTVMPFGARKPVAKTSMCFPSGDTLRMVP